MIVNSVGIDRFVHPVQSDVDRLGQCVRQRLDQQFDILALKLRSLMTILQTSLTSGKSMAGCRYRAGQRSGVITPSSHNARPIARIKQVEQTVNIIHIHGSSGSHENQKKPRPGYLSSSYFLPIAFKVPSAFNIPVGSPILILSLGSNGLTIDLRGNGGICTVPGPPLNNVVSTRFEPSDSIVHQKRSDFFGTIPSFSGDAGQLMQ